MTASLRGALFHKFNFFFRQAAQLIDQPANLPLPRRRIRLGIAPLGGEDAVNLGETTAAAEDLTQSPDCDLEVFPES